MGNNEYMSFNNSQGLRYDETSIDYAFDSIDERPTKQMLNQYWSQKRESAPISTKWMFFYVRILMVINLIIDTFVILDSIFNIFIYYNIDSVIRQKYDFIFIYGSLSLYICAYSSIIFIYHYLKCFDCRGLMWLWINTIIQIIPLFFFVIGTLIIPEYMPSIQDNISLFIIPLVFFLPNLIYFEKRRFLYYEESTYTVEFKIDKKHKLGIIILYSITILLFFLQIALSLNSH